MLAFTSVYFSESRLFNGLRPFGIKNLLAPFRRSGSACNASHGARLAAAHLEKSGLPSGKVYGEIADPPRICWLQPGYGSQKLQVYSGFESRRQSRGFWGTAGLWGASWRASAGCQPASSLRSFDRIRGNSGELSTIERRFCFSLGQCAAQLTNTHNLLLRCGIGCGCVRPVETNHIGFANRASTAAK